MGGTGESLGMQSWYQRSLKRTAAPTDKGGAEMVVRTEIDNLTQYVHDNILPAFYNEVSNQLPAVIRPITTRLVSNLTQAMTMRGIPFNAGHNTTFMTLMTPIAVRALVSNPAMGNITNMMRSSAPPTALLKRWRNDITGYALQQTETAKATQNTPPSGNLGAQQQGGMPGTGGTPMGLPAASTGGQMSSKTIQ